MMRRLLILSFLALAACDPPPRRTMAEITAACDRQFGAGTPGSAQCQLDIVTREVAKDHDRRMDAAR